MIRGIIRGLSIADYFAVVACVGILIFVAGWA